MTKEESQAIFTERLKKLLEDSGVTSSMVCQNALNGYRTSNFSRFTTGKAIAPDDIIQNLASYFHVREAWLRGYDDYKTVEDLEKAINGTKQEISSAWTASANYHRSLNNLPDLDEPIAASDDDAIAKIVHDKLFHAYSKILISLEPENINDILDPLNYAEFIASSVDNAYEFYMKHLNK